MEICSPERFSFFGVFLFGVLWLFFYPLPVEAVQILPYQGRILDTERKPLEWPFLKIHVFLIAKDTINQNCALWYEVHPISTLNTRGFFSIPVGQGHNQTLGITTPPLLLLSDIWLRQRANSCLQEVVPPVQTFLPVTFSSPRR